ncbi:hypothetical protein [Capnocytophaga canis]|uniref:hypothetical protein n=1 Tax=Capnocytophaga canis TaxID=1848903 RepID=UPI001562E2E1|nr:hypothetical protein [Capnocytophaga canis]
MKNKFLWLAVLAFIGFNIGTWIHHLNYKKQSKIVISALESIQNSSRSVEKIIQLSVENSDIQLKNVFVKDSSNNQVPLKNYFNKDKKYLLVSRFSESNCESCVNHSIKMAKSKLNEVGHKNVLFLGAYRNNKIFNNLKPLYEIDTLKVANIGSLTIPAENSGYPYYFVIDSTLKVQHLFFPDKGSPQMDEKYLDFIKTKFFSSN